MFTESNIGRRIFFVAMIVLYLVIITASLLALTVRPASPDVSRDTKDMPKSLE
jgi:hypothetical protein